MPVIKVTGSGKGVPGSHAGAAVMAAFLTADYSKFYTPPKTRREKPEATRPGNPNALTIKQHIFPTRSIERFTDTDGRVAVRELGRKTQRAAKPQDQIFCALRAWDQRSESGFMKSIEDEFQTIMSQIIAGDVTTISPDQKAVIEHFYALWYMRARHQFLEAQEVDINLDGEDLTKESEENLEKNHVLYVRKGGKMPARLLNGLKIQRGIDGYTQSLAAITRWGIVRPVVGEFVVPDVPHATIIPLSQKLALASEAGDGFVTESNLAGINQFMAEHSENYYFARDLDECPLSGAKDVLPV